MHRSETVVCIHDNMNTCIDNDWYSNFTTWCITTTKRKVHVEQELISIDQRERERERLTWLNTKEETLLHDGKHEEY